MWPASVSAPGPLVRWGLDCADSCGRVPDILLHRLSSAFSPSLLSLFLSVSVLERPQQFGASPIGLDAQLSWARAGGRSGPAWDRRAAPPPPASLCLISFVSLEFPAPMNFQSLISELAISSAVCTFVVRFEFRLLCWYSISPKNLSTYSRYWLVWIF